ncbi:FtsQ-type POTRA domain-containing protein [Candidatus Saganbacteria bacterium]|nr:FtsQ-type POTRA domain-containing protein [Candidatus Saganbacteria bacterium]
MAVSRRKRRRKLSWYLFWYVILFFFLAAVITSIISLPLWQITEVKAEGVRLLNDSEIIRLAGVPLSENIFLTRFEAARRRLMMVPLMKKVDFVRSLPGTVVIKVTERRETAVAVMGGQSVLMDEEGVILNPAVTGEVHVEFPDISNLPVVNGIRPEWIKQGRLSGEMGGSIIALLREFKHFISSARLQVEVGDVENINLMVDDTLKVKIGNSADLDRKIRVFQAIFNRNRDRKNDLEYIDVRLPDYPVAKFK